jgi:hypothetical protein
LHFSISANKVFEDKLEESKQVLEDLQDKSSPCKTILNDFYGDLKVKHLNQVDGKRIVEKTYKDPSNVLTDIADKMMLKELDTILIEY